MTMSLSPIEQSSALRIGVVEYVSPSEIKVTLDLDAPDGVAANAGIPRSFPKINSYVLVTTEAGYIVGQVEWISIERSPFPKRKGFQDYGLIDLPFPLRKMKVSPLGILALGDDDHYEFIRGIQSFPSVGEPVLIPTDKQLRAVIESGENRRVKIGTSPLAANADVMIDPDRLFGRHLAVLGNTGSGKSCTVAGLIQWSLEAVKLDGKNPNARFIILDPNGEYSRVFGTNGRVFKVNSEDNPLEVPIWFWNSMEWTSFAQASAKAQVPLIKRTLRAMRNEVFEQESDLEIEIKRFLGTILTSLNHESSTGSPWGSFPRPKNFLLKLVKWKESLEYYRSRISDDRLNELIQSIQVYENQRSGQYPTYESDAQEIEGISTVMTTTYKAFGGSEKSILPKNEDIPIPFKGEVFLNLLDALAQETGNEQYVEFLLARIRTLLADTRMTSIIGDEVEITLEKWLGDYIGKNNDPRGCITIIDLSLVPSEIIHIITSVIARMIFEALQRYRKLEGNSLPTTLVMEEAHTFIKRYKEDSDNYASTICSQVFEKISREGRKFGLGLVLSSQRPSELSPTVLSQCNSFILHRISNDRDQELVSKLIPDNLRGMLRELPSLPSRKAILLGWASELPLLVHMNFLKVENRPQSDDPDFWDVWQGKDKKGKQVKRNVDWKKIADEWQEKSD